MYEGIYRGAVHDINDPENRGRLRALVPAVLGEAPSGWSEPVLPTSLTTRWSVGDRVWVMFEDGDLNRPVYLSRMQVEKEDIAAGAIQVDPTATQVFSQDPPPETTDGYSEGQAWWQVRPVLDELGNMTGEDLIRFWRVVGNEWRSQNVVNIPVLEVNNALIGALTGKKITGATVQTRPEALKGIKLIAGVDDAGNPIDAFYVYDELGVPFISAVPSTGMAVVAGLLKSSSLTVSPVGPDDKTSLAGLVELTRHPNGTAGIFRLTGYATAPASAPTAWSDYDMAQFTDDSKWNDRHGWSTNGTLWFTARMDSSNGDIIAEKWNANGTLNTSAVVDTSMGVYSSVVNGSDFYILYRSLYDNKAHVYRLNASTFAITGDAIFNQFEDAKAPAIGYDAAASRILVADVRASDTTVPNRLRIRRFTWPIIDGGNLVLDTFVDTAFAYNYDLAGISYGQFDLGANRYIFTARSGNGLFKVVDDTGAAVANEDWEQSARRVGFTYSSGSFKSIDYSGTVRIFTGMDKTTTPGSGNMTKWVANVLARLDRTVTVTSTGTNVLTSAAGFANADQTMAISGGSIPGGTTITTYTDPSTVTVSQVVPAGTYTATITRKLRTDQSPRAKVNMLKRQRLYYSASAINAGGSNSPDRIEVYVGQGTNDPGRAAMAKQADPVVGFAVGNFATLSTTVGGQNVPPSLNEFIITTGTGQQIQYADGTVFIDAFGNGNLKAGTFRDAIDARAVLQADARVLAANGAWTSFTPSFTAATTNPTLANFTITGRYSQVGKVVRFDVVITCNSATGVGAGTYTFGLPVTARNADEVVVVARQSGPTHTFVGSGTSTTTFILSLTSTEVNGNAANMGVVAGTVLRISGMYEAA